MELQEYLRIIVKIPEIHDESIALQKFLEIKKGRTNSKGDLLESTEDGKSTCVYSNGVISTDVTSKLKEDVVNGFTETNEKQQQEEDDDDALGPSEYEDYVLDDSFEPFGLSESEGSSVTKKFDDEYGIEDATPYGKDIEDNYEDGEDDDELNGVKIPKGRVRDSLVMIGKAHSNNKKELLEQQLQDERDEDAASGGRGVET